MKNLVTLTTLSIVLAMSSLAFGQGTSETEQVNPFSQLDEAFDLITNTGHKRIYNKLEEALRDPKKNARSYLLIAELMKRLGDLRAEHSYEKAIEADISEPAYELFYADYLRNFRGPRHPLFPEAERHYLQALKKLRHIKESREWDEVTRERVERGLVALYQEDGLPVINLPLDTGVSEEPIDRPLLFFSSINRFAQLTGDFENVDDVRAFTSEALLVSSRRNEELSESALRGIIRVKGQFETLNRFRFRYKAWPVLDVSYKYRKIDHGQITNFFEPDKFNEIHLNEYGISIEKPFNVSPYFDLFVQGSYKRISRKGLIEFLPENKENINQYAVNGAISRFVGPDKAILESTYVFQDINQATSRPIRRDRRIIAATITYQLLRFSLSSVHRQRFETRGIHFFAGIANDRERFGSVQLVKNDYFLGSSVKGPGPYEVTFQPTIFTSKVQGRYLSAKEFAVSDQFRVLVEN